MSLRLLSRCELTILSWLQMLCPGDRPQGDQQPGENQTGRCHLPRTLPVLVSVFSVTLGSFHKSLNLLGRGGLFSSLLSPQDVMPLSSLSPWYTALMNWEPPSGLEWCPHQQWDSIREQGEPRGVQGDTYVTAYCGDVLLVNIFLQGVTRSLETT